MATLGRADTALQPVPATSVTGPEVADSSLTVFDVAKARGILPLNLPNLVSGECSFSLVETGKVLDQDFLLVSSPGASGPLDVTGRQETTGGTILRMTFCNTSVVDINPDAATYSWAVIEN